MIFTLIIALISILILASYFKERTSPPGPRGIPILGYIPLLGSKGIINVQKLCAKYGPVMKVNLLNENYYFLNSYEAVCEAFINQSDKFAGRPVTKFNLISFIYGKKSLMACEGEYWNIQHKFFLNKLSALGMGKSDFAIRIHELCDDLIKYIPVGEEMNDLRIYLAIFVSNVISTILYSKKYTPTDQEYKQLMTKVAKFIETRTDLYFFLTGPVIAFLMKLNKNIWTSLTNMIDEITNFIDEIIQNKFDSDDQNECGDLIDYCKKEMKGPNAQLFDRKAIVKNTMLMFTAGADTTASTLHFAFNFMAANPKIQKKVYDEIVNVFGKNYRILPSEAKRLSYTRAVISEVQRFACIAPLGLIRVNTEEATICGYRFPKRSNFIANFYSLSRDKRYFKNPDVFDPNHFLDENGNYISVEASMPFGAGKRKCLGLKLAQMEILIAFTRLIQEFQWMPAEGEQMKFEVIQALARQLCPNKLIVKKRQ